MLTRLCDSNFLHQLHAGDPRVDGRNRRRSRLESRSGARGRIISVIHREDVLVGEPSRRRRPDLLADIAPHIEEAVTRTAEQVLEHACAKKADARILQADWELS